MDNIEQIKHSTLLQLYADNSGELPEELPHTLLSKQLRKFSPADMYACISRNWLLEYLIPLALERLQGDPWLQARQYPGDLLTAVLEADSRFWLEHYDAWLLGIDVLTEAICGVNDTVKKKATNEVLRDFDAGETKEFYLPQHLGDDFMGALLHFRSLHATGIEE